MGEGTYKDNMKDGEGRMEFPDGGVYEGSWKFDKRHGDGAYWYPNGDIYSGEWRFGCKHGRGAFKDNKPNGPGSFLFKHSGNRQEGEYLLKVPGDGEEVDPEAPPIQPQWVGGATRAIRAEENLWDKL